MDALRSPGLCFVVLAIGSAFACMFMTMTVYVGVGLVGSTLRMACLGVLAGWSGLALGLVALSLVAKSEYAYVVLAVSLLAAISLGGYLAPLEGLPRAVRVVSSASPTRWAFEGMLTAEAEVRATVLNGKDEDHMTPIDQAETYFPLASIRRGPLASSIALLGFTLGLAPIWIAASSRPRT